MRKYVKNAPIIPLVLILMIALSSVACGLTGGAEDGKTFAESIVVVTAGKDNEIDRGCGFIVANDGEGIFIATANHVVSKHANMIKVQFSNGERYTAKEVATDVVKDLCLLRVDMALDNEPLTLFGERVSGNKDAIGFYWGSNDTAIKGKSTDIILLHLKERVKMYFLSVDDCVGVCELSWNNLPNTVSGAPVIDYDGNVVGLLSIGAVYHNKAINGMICIDELDGLLNEAGLKVKRSPLKLSQTWIGLISAGGMIALCGLVWAVTAAANRRKRIDVPKSQEIISPTVQRPVRQLEHPAQVGREIICQRCGRKLLWNSVFCCYCGEELKTVSCQNCGAELQENAAFCHKCGNQIERHKAFCRKCGSEMPASAKFCHKCGNIFEE